MEAGVCSLQRRGDTQRLPRPGAPQGLAQFHKELLGQSTESLTLFFTRLVGNYRGLWQRRTGWWTMLFLSFLIHTFVSLGLHPFFFSWVYYISFSYLAAFDSSYLHVLLEVCNFVCFSSINLSFYYKDVSAKNLKGDRENYFFSPLYLPCNPSPTLTLISTWPKLELSNPLPNYTEDSLIKFSFEWSERWLS